MTRKHKRVMEYYSLHPFATYREIAEQCEVTRDTVMAALRDESAQEYLKELNAENWKAMYTEAQVMCRKLVERGKWQAVEFVLKANGIVPVEKMEVKQDDNNIYITVETNKNDGASGQ